MGRIEEALRRVERGGHSEPEVAAGTVFAPAWKVDPQAEPEPARLAPDVKPIEFTSRKPRLGIATEWRERLATADNPNHTLTEQFRRLAGLLHQARQTDGLSTVMVTSAAPGDGKTLTAVNLSLVLAESYRYKVLLIDADLRRPSIPNIVDVGEGAGLGEALRAATDQKLALVPITNRLSVLPAGTPIANSLDALTSPRMARILDEAVEHFDWVVLDAPPVGPTADARLLTGMVGGTLFVVRAAVTQAPEVVKAIDILGRDRILGVVLNGMIDLPESQYYYGSSAPQTGT